MLTPSPNPDTDVLLPPPNSFTLSSTPHHLGLGATLTRQHARQSSTPSDMEQDTPPGLSPSDGPSTLLPTNVSSRLYPGLAVPVLSRVSSEVGGDKTDRSWKDGTWRQAPTPAPHTHSAYNALTHSASIKSYQSGKENALESTPSVHKDPASILKSVLKDGKSLSSSFSQERGGMFSRSRDRSSPPKPVLVKARSVSPKKGPGPIDSSYHKKVFNTHSRSKSSSSLKPERAYEHLARSKDDITMAYTRSLSTGSTIHDLLSRTLQVSPSHTEMCLTHVPAKKSEKPIVPRGKNGDRLFTSRSLERPSSPRRDRALSPSRRVVSLPISRGRSRERSPSPDRNYLRKSIEQLRDSISMSSSTYNDIDLELGNIPRTLTHEEEINLIISGEANLLRMSTPESFPSVEVQSNESVISNESEYEMRF